MKKYSIIGLVSMVLLLQEVQASNPINLYLPETRISLDQETAESMANLEVVQTLKLGNIRIPLDFEKKIAPELALDIIETDFQYRTDETALRDFFVSKKILKEKADIVTIKPNPNDPTRVQFEGVPTSGIEINIPALQFMLDNALKVNRTHVRVPATKNFSTVVLDENINYNGIKEVITIGNSNFKGSSNGRRLNIKAAVNKFNGIVIPKDAEFSFNETLNDVDVESGFVYELVIKGNDTYKELGGGVCQVSTTAFRAAFHAGLPITSRKAHSYAVPYYQPVGLDAAIYLGSSDLKFQNNTPGDILVQSYIENNELYFAFYGTKDGRDISFTGPFISDIKPPPEARIVQTEELPAGVIEEVNGAYEGFRAEWVRSVKNAGLIEAESFVSNYKPWPAKILKGPDVKKEIPAPIRPNTSRKRLNYES